MTDEQYDALINRVERYGHIFPKLQGCPGIRPGADLTIIVDRVLQALTPTNQGWQSIETAPKDGTVIDLYGPEHGRWTDMYWGLPDHSCGEMGQYCDSDWHRLKPGWVCSTFNEMMSSGFTHWMPLPPAPAHTLKGTFTCPICGKDTSHHHEMDAQPKADLCPACDGKGYLTKMTLTENAIWECAACHGTGKKQRMLDHDHPD